VASEKRLFRVDLRDPDHIGCFVFIDVDLLAEQLNAAKKNKSRRSKWGALIVEYKALTPEQDEFLRKPLGTIQ
jgi:hypothetical protein